MPGSRPAGEAQVTVDQVLLDGDGLRFGGQIADRIQMVLTGIAKQLVAEPVALRACIGQCCHFFAPSISALRSLVGGQGAAGERLASGPREHHSVP